MTKGIIERLEIKAGMILMGERIEWGSDAALMQEAANVIHHLHIRLDDRNKRIKELEQQVISITEMKTTAISKNEKIETVEQQAGEPVYLFRRKGLGRNDFVTCTKERFDALSENSLFDVRVLYTRPISTAPAAVPEGYVLLPKELTAENGAKALLTGEFFVEGCDGRSLAVHWTLIKKIYAHIVEHCQ